MTGEDDEHTFDEKIEMFLRRNFPQIQMHGGESSILEADSEEGFVKIELSGACSGCGISPMTVQAIRTRMEDQIEAVSEVSVSTGMESTGIDASSPETSSNKDEDETPDAPF